MIRSSSLQKSLKFKIILPVLGMSIPVIILLFIINAYAIKKVQQQIYSYNLNLMSAHVSELEAELDSATNILIKENIQRISIFSSLDERIRYYATMDYHRRNANVLNDFTMLEGQIAYSPINGNTVIYYDDYGSDYQKRDAVFQYVKKHVEELAALNGRWHIFEIDGDWILLGAAGDENAVFCFWATCEQVLKPVRNWELAGKSFFYIMDNAGNLLTNLENDELKELICGNELNGYYFVGERNKYLISGVEVASETFRLMNAIEKKDCLGIFPQIQILGVCMLIFVLFVGIPWMLHILEKNIFSPINRLEVGIRKVEQGDFSVRIDNLSTSREMEHLIDSFNEMIFQIYDLKIRFYEKNLEKQKLELDYLNLQMKPHFYLNALAIISTTAQIGDMQMLQKMIKNLSMYMRYIMGSRKKVVTLREELEHVGYYLEIMRTKLGNHFICRKSIEENLMNLEVPPLMLQTLVENSLKYAFDAYGETVVEVIATETGGKALIQIMDNGDGYSDQYLEGFYKNQPPEKEHIGIINLRSRLKMMYGESAEMKIYNRDSHGACTEIEILR